MHEIITTSLHSRKVLTVPTDWNDDISEIGTTCTNNNISNHKFSPLNVLRRKKHESPRNFQVVRPTEDSSFFFVEEEKELREFEPEYYWEKSCDNVELHDPSEDGREDGTITKTTSTHPFLPDKSQVIRNHEGILDPPREPRTAVAMEGLAGKQGEERLSRKPSKGWSRPGRDEQSTDTAVQMSLVLQQRKRSAKKIFDMATSSKRNAPTVLAELATANRPSPQQDNSMPLYSFNRHSRTMESKRTQNLKTIDEGTLECDDSKAKPSVSAAIVRRSTGRPVSEWFKPRKTIIPLVTGKAAESNNHDSDVAIPGNGMQDCAVICVPDDMGMKSQIEKKEDPFNQLCLDIWSSGTELLTTTSAVLDSIGTEAMRSLQQMVSTTMQEPTKVIMHSHDEPSPEDKAQDSTHSITSDKLDHPCMIRNFQKQSQSMETKMRTANHVFHLTYVPPIQNGQLGLPRHNEKQCKDKAFKKRIGLPAVAKVVGQNGLRRTKQSDGQKFDI